MKCTLAGMLLLALGAPLPAQVVGRLPEESPFRDLRYRQDVSLFTGYYAAGRDPAGVAPQGGPTIGARYGLRVGGPMYLVARSTLVLSERTVIDPRLSADERVLGTESWPFLLTDLDFALSLTGDRSWRNLVPELTTGIGLHTDFRSRPDTGNYQFGTGFAFNMGGGVRYVAGDRIEVRLDFTDYLYRISYPALYFAPAPDDTQVLPSTQRRQFWKHNLAFTIGASYRFWR
ncbi:MAG TPA: hypothetical protein VMM18_17895 [Gemmatimonadaceae bacterium]|nr:hypothetical protein [Gemmatimonadaceae bacterium]